MKKFLSLILATLMMTSVLAGCGGDTTDAPADDDAQTEGEVPCKMLHG